MGIGRAVARVLAASGCRVVCVDINAATVGETVEIIEAEVGPRMAISAVADVRDYAALECAAKAAVSTFGGLDFCIANAGIGREGHVSTFLESDFDTGMWQFS